MITQQRFHEPLPSSTSDDEEFVAPLTRILSWIGLHFSLHPLTIWQRFRTIGFACLLLASTIWYFVAESRFLGKPNLSFAFLFGDPIVFLLAMIMYFASAWTFRRNGGRNNLRMFGALFDRQQDILLRRTRIEFGRRLRSIYMPILLTLSLIIPIISFIFDEYQYQERLNDPNNPASKAFLVPAHWTLSPAFCMILLISVWIICFNLIALQAHILAVQRLCEVVHERSIFDEVLADYHQQQILSNASSSSVSSTSDSLSPPLAFPTPELSSSDELMTSSDFYRWLLCTLRRNRLCLSELYETNFWMHVGMALFLCWSSIYYVSVLLANASTASGGKFYSFAFDAVLYLVSLILILFQLARVSRAHQQCVQRLCAVSLHSPDTAKILFDGALTTPSAILPKAIRADSSSKLNELPMDLLENYIPKHSWMIQIILSTQSQDTLRLVGIPISTSLVVQFMYYLSLGLVAFLPFVKQN